MMESIEKLRERSHLDDDRWTLSDGRVMWYTNGEPNDPNAVNWGEQLRKIADEIEREIAERYMELPVDADGVPIRVGDEMESDNERFVVCAVALGRVHRWDVHNIGELDRGTVAYPPNSLHHYKPRTLEDVLAEYRLEADRLFCDPSIGGEDRADALESLDAKYAAEIRKLMGVGE